MKIIVQTLLLASTLLAAHRSVHCDENAFSQSKTAASTADGVRSTVTETGSPAKSESTISSSSEPLNSESSNRNTQTYNSIYSGRVQTHSAPVVTHDSPPQQDSQDYNGATRGQTILKPPITVYRPVDITNLEYDDQSQQSYAPQVQPQQQELQYAPQQTYAQTPAQEVSQYNSQENIDQSFVQSAAPQSTGYSSTYSSPAVKVVSHTRTIMPIVYSGNQRIKPSDDDEEAERYSVGSVSAQQEQQPQQAQPILQHELTYSQEAPGLAYAKPQQSYSSSSQNPDPRYPSNYGIAFQTANQLPAAYAEQKYAAAPEQKAYTPLQPIQAHVQVVQDDSPKAYGERTQKLSIDHGQQPSKLYSYPPSPSLASLLTQYGTSQENTNYRAQQLQQYAILQQQQQQQQQQLQPQQQSYSKNLVQTYSPADDSDPDLSNKANAPYEFTIGDLSNYAVQQQQVPQVQQQLSIYSPQQQLVGKSTPAVAEINKSPINQYATSGLVNSDSDANSYGIQESYKPVANSGINNVKQSYSETARPVTTGTQRQPPRLYKLGPDIEYGFIPLSLANLRDLGGYGPQGYDKAKQNNNYGEDIRGKPDASGYGKERGNDERANSLVHFPNDDGDSDGGDGIGKLLANVAHKTSNYKGAGDQPYSAGAKPYKSAVGGSGRPGFGGGRVPYQKKALEKSKYLGLDGAKNYMRDYKNYAQLDNDDDKDLYSSDDYGNGKDINHKSDTNKTSDSDNYNQNDNKLPADCLPWNCNPWYAVSPNSPYNSVGSPKLNARKRLRGYPRGGSSELPPGASYNPRDVGLDESVLAQLNMDESPFGRYASPSFDLLSNADTGFMTSYGLKPKKVPYSSSGQGFRSQYGYAAASELSPMQAPSPNSNSNNSAKNPVMDLLGNFKGLRSLVSYLTGGING